MTTNQDENPSGYKPSTLKALSEISDSDMDEINLLICPACCASEECIVWDELEEASRCLLCGHIF